MNNEIQEDYCSSEISKLLKSKGFACYKSMDNSIINTPTHALAIKWIRENFGIHVYPQFQTWDEGCWTANWCFKQDILWLFHDLGEKDGMLWKRTKFNSPEEATEAGLKYVLENLV